MIAILTILFFLFFSPPVNSRTTTNNNHLHENMPPRTPSTNTTPVNDDADEEHLDQQRSPSLPGAFPTTTISSTSSTPPIVHSPLSEPIIQSTTEGSASPPIVIQTGLNPLRVEIPPLPHNPFASASLLSNQFSPPLLDAQHHYNSTSPYGASTSALVFDTPALEHDNPLFQTVVPHDLSSDPSSSSNGTLGDEFYFDDEGLGTLEKIWLFARTECSCPETLRTDCTHTQRRVFIAKSLPNLLPDVTPHDAVEYVLPLLNSLGTDPEESVREAFVSEIVPTIWWFYSHCQLIDGDAEAAPHYGEGLGADQSGLLEHEQQVQRDGEQQVTGLDSGDARQQQQQQQGISTSHHEIAPGDGDDDETTSRGVEDSATGHDSTQSPDPIIPPLPSPDYPLLSVQFFTPLLGCLLLSPNAVITDSTRAAIVEMLRRVTSVNEDGIERTLEEDEARDRDERPFGPREKRMLERELLMGVVIGVARLPEGMEIHEQEDQHGMGMGEDEAAGAGWGEVWVDEGRAEMGGSPEQTEGEYWGAGPSVEEDMRRQEEALQHHSIAGPSSLKWVSPVDKPSAAENRRQEENPDSAENKDSEPCHEDDESAYLEATTVPLPPAEEPPSISITTSPLTELDNDRNPTFNITSPRTPPNERSMSPVIIPPTPPSPPSGPPSRLFIPSTPPSLVARSPLPPTAEPPTSPTLPNVSLPGRGTPIAIPVTPAPMTSTPISALALGPRSAIPSRMLEGIFSPMSASSSGSGGGLLGHGGSSRSSLGGLMGLPSPSWMMSPSASPPNSRRMSELRISMEDESSDMSTERVGLGFLPRTPPRQEHGVLLAVGDEDEDEDEDEVEAWGPLSASPTKVKRRRPSLSPVQPSTIASSPSSSSQPLLLGPSALPSTPILQERRTLAEALLQPTASSSGSSSSSGDPSDDPSPSGSGTQVGHHSRTVTPGESPRSTSDEGSSASFRETPLDEEEEEEGHAGRPGPLSLSDLSPAIEESETSPEPFSLVDLSPTGVGEPPPGMSGPVIVGEAVPMRPSDIAFPPSASFTSVSMFMPHPPASSPATSSSDNTTASGRTLLSATSTETPPSAVSSDVIRTPEDGEDAEDNGGNSVGLGSPEQSLQEGWINPYFSSALVHDADDDDGAGADDFDVHGGGRPPFSRKNTQSSNNESSNGSSSGNTATGPERESSDQEYTPENEQERERSDGSGEAKATSPPPAPATSSPSVDVGRNEASGPVAVEQERQLHTMIPTSPVPQESMEQARRAMVVAEEEKRDVLDSRHPPPASFAIPSTSRPMTGMDPSEALPPLRAEPSFNPPAPSSPHYIAPLTSPTGEVPPPTIFQRRRSSANAGMLGLPPALAPSSPTNPIRAGDSPYPSPPEYGSPIVAWDPSSRLVGSPPPRPSAVHLSSGGTLYHPIPATQFDFPTPVHGSSNPTPVGEITPPLDLNPHHDHPEPFLTDVADDPTLWQHHEGDTPDDGLEGAGEDAAVGRVASMSLIAAVTAAGVVSQDTKRIFAEEVVRVGRDHVYWVRREAAYALGALAKVVSQEVLIDAMLPLYEDMTADEIWHVRQSALFALPGILVRLTPVRRRELALAQCRLLAHDTAKSVRAALLEVMGEVIYSFRDDEGGPPDDLVDLFIGKNEQHEDATWTEPPDSGTRMWGLITPFKNDPTPVTPGGSDPPLRSLFESNVDPSRFDPSHFRSDSSPIMAITNGAYKRDPERVLICAFNFPAVVASMGASRWVELRSHYIGLTQHTAVKVRRTLAASIGEIARIIGEAHAHRDLTGVWWELVHDDTADVREKIIGCLDMYVAALPADDRRNVAVQLGGLWDGTLVGWREREALAAQLGSLSELLSPVGRADSVRAMMWKALTAAVAAVREAAVSSSPKYFEFLPEEVALAAKDDLFTLAASRSFRQRVTFVAVCQARVIARTLLSDGCQETDYLQVFEALSHDPVVDVRIGLSRLISLLSEQSYLDPATRPAPITALIRTFAADPSPQVKSFVAFVASSPTVPLSAFSATSSPSISTHHFGLFSRPPTRATLLTDSLEDLMHADTSDMDSDSESGSAIPVGSGSTRATAGVPSMTTAVALTTNYDDNPFLHDPDLHVS